MAYRIVQPLVEHKTFVAAGRLHTAPPGASREPATLHEPALSTGSGYYAILGWDSDRAAYSVFLRSATGTLLHTWPIDEMTITDKAQHRQNGPHAMEVLPDGSLLVSFDWLGLMARLDSCGRKIWSRDGYFHHSFSPAADGGMWTWYGGKLTAYGQIQDILKFDPLTGKDLARISLNNDIILRTAESALAFSLYKGYDFTPDDRNPADIFHPNDIEELSPALAPAFPRFSAGDLMLSFRNLDMVAVIAPSGELKWYQDGPWQKQHDPDFEADGRISVFNNSEFRSRSSIISIDPVTRRMEDSTANFDGPFKSESRGKHQRLPNGNRLITIPEQGQAIEVAPDGTLVLEFNIVFPGDLRFNDDLVNAKWLPADFFKTTPGCSS
jgi:hypothetical protein